MSTQNNNPTMVASPFATAPGEILHVIFLECILAEFLPVEGGLAEEDLFEVEESSWDGDSSSGTSDSSDPLSEIEEISTEELDALDLDEPLPPGYNFTSGLHNTLHPNAVSPAAIGRLEYAYTQAPWLLGQICRWWRQILMSSSNLWRYINVDVDDYMFGRYHSSQELLEHQLTLSGHQTLHIRFTSCLDTGRAYTLFEMLFEHQQRWETVELSMPDSALIHVLEYVDMAVPDTEEFGMVEVSENLPSFPSLKSLTSFNHDELPEEECRIPWFKLFAQSPNMEKFTSMRPILMDPLPAHWEHLSCLSLYIYRPLLAYPLLRQFPTLTECTLEFQGTPFPFAALEINRDHRKTVHLPALSAFTLRMNRDIYNDMVIFMDSIDAPNLELFAYYISSDSGPSRRVDANQERMPEPEMTDVWLHETGICRFLENCGQNLRCLFIDCKLAINGQSQQFTPKDLFRYTPHLEQATFASKNVDFISLTVPTLRILDLYLPEMTTADLLAKAEGSDGQRLKGVSCECIVRASTELLEDEKITKITRLRGYGINLDIWEGTPYLSPNMWGIPVQYAHPSLQSRMFKRYIVNRGTDYSHIAVST